MVPIQQPFADLLGVLAQSDTQLGFEYGLGLLLEFVFTVVITLIFGAIVLAIAPQFTRDGVEYVREKPVEGFVYGLGATVVIVIAFVLLAITVIGLIIVFPGVIVLAILGIAGSMVAVIALGAALYAEDDYTAALVAGALVYSVLTTVPVLGGIVSFVVGTIGFGYVVHYFLAKRSGGDEGGDWETADDRTSDTEWSTADRDATDRNATDHDDTGRDATTDTDRDEGNYWDDRDDPFESDDSDDESDEPPRSP